MIYTYNLYIFLKIKLNLYKVQLISIKIIKGLLKLTFKDSDSINFSCFIINNLKSKKFIDLLFNFLLVRIHIVFVNNKPLYILKYLNKI